MILNVSQGTLNDNLCVDLFSALSQDAVKVPARSYKVVQHKKNQADAAAACLADGGKLADLGTACLLNDVR